MLSDGKLHGVAWRTGVRGQIGLGFNLYVVPPQDRIVLISGDGVMEYRVSSGVNLELTKEWKTRGS